MERIAIKAPLYAIEIEYVNPKGTTHSKEHDEVMKKYGLDRHTASAYLIALKGIEGYRMIQKATIQYFCPAPSSYGNLKAKTTR